MKVARTFFRVALVAGFLLFVGVFAFTQPCTDGVCAVANVWRLPLSLDRLFASTQEVAPPDRVTVLVVGVDNRRGDEVMHCDAIHVVDVDVARDRVTFVNIPRGTYSYIRMPDGWRPKQELIDAVAHDEKVRRELQQQEGLKEEEMEPVAADVEGSIRKRAWQMEQYISNLCAYEGFDAFVKEVERVGGRDVDYFVRVGFSQAEGVLRVLSFDPASTLQFLRHRKTYAQGDVQRSYNQSVFLEDLLRTKTDLVAGLPLTAQAALYHLVDTDMPYGVARGLLAWLQTSSARTDADRITHVTKPSGLATVSAIHVDQDATEAQVQALYKRLRQYDHSFTVTDVQPTLVAFIRTQLTSAYHALIKGNLGEARTALSAVADQQLWHQVSDASTRQQVQEWVAVLDSTLTWFETYSQETTLTLATNLVWSLQLETDAQGSVERIQDHLEQLLRPRLRAGGLQNVDKH